jgi:predicted RNA-binding Zn-ribbon protein involved in translation (DUF1610 family)
MGRLFAEPSKGKQEAMASPEKTHVTAECPKCGAVMKIRSVQTVFDDEGVMEHGFECPKCSHIAAFRFPKAKAAYK